MLGSRDSNGNLPIHTAVLENSTDAIFVPTLANIGWEYKIGGEGAKGGLIVDRVKSDGKIEDGSSCLSLLAFGHRVEVLKAIRNISPDLLTLSDVNSCKLLYHAIYYLGFETVEWLLKTFPSSLFHKTIAPYHYGTEGIQILPIAACTSPEMFKLVFKSAIKYDPDHESFGGLFSPAYRKSQQIHPNLAVQYRNKHLAFQLIGHIMSQYQQIPVLHKMIEAAPEYATKIMTNCPHSCFIRDKQSSRLPFHVALATGMKWSDTLVAILHANMPHLKDMDPVTSLYPCGLAAMEPSCDLNTIYYLLRMHPGHVEHCRRREKRKCDSMPSQL